jgi:hypothetical protein
MNMDGSHLAQMVRSAFSGSRNGSTQAALAPEKRTSSAATGVERMSDCGPPQ